MFNTFEYLEQVCISCVEHNGLIDSISKMSKGLEKVTQNTASLGSKITGKEHVTASDVKEMVKGIQKVYKW